MDQSVKRKLIITAIALVIIIGGAALVANNNKDNSNNPKDFTNGQGDYYDKNSRETVSNPDGKSPDTYGRNPSAPIFLGTANLLDYGVASDQEQDMQFAIFQYFNGNKMKVKEVSVVVDSIAPVPHDRNSASTVDTINFNIVVDRKTTYKIRMDYFDLSSIQLFMSDTAGNQIYDSGVVSNQHI